MLMVEHVYLIASAAGAEVLTAALAALSCAGFAPASSADFPSFGEAVSALMSADAVAVVDGWESSPGARVEADLAAALGLPVLTLPDLLPLAA